MLATLHRRGDMYFSVLYICTCCTTLKNILFVNKWKKQKDVWLLALLYQRNGASRGSIRGNIRNLDNG